MRYQQSIPTRIRNDLLSIIVFTTLIISFVLLVEKVIDWIALSIGAEAAYHSLSGEGEGTSSCGKVESILEGEDTLEGDAGEGNETGLEEDEISKEGVQRMNWAVKPTLGGGEEDGTTKANGIANGNGSNNTNGTGEKAAELANGCEKGSELEGNGTPDGYENGEVNGHTNGHTNGTINGKANGTINGHVNESINGHINESINGYVNESIDGHNDATSNGHMDEEANGLINGHANGQVNDTAKTNGTNGHSNNKANGQTNGHVNGSVKTNGYHANGQPNGQKNGQANGTMNGHVNGQFNSSVNPNGTNGHLNHQKLPPQ